MFPTITVLGREFSMYSIMACIGIFISLFVASRAIKRLKFKTTIDELIILGLWSALGLVVGGHLVYGLTNFQWIIYLFEHLDQVTSFQVLWDTLAYIFGGQVFYGGLIGALIAGFIYLKVTRKDAEMYAYIVAPLIPLFHAFGRIGCFLGGCCYGIEIEHGVTFEHSLVESANGVPRLPIQLIEAGCNFLLFLVLYYLQRKGKCRQNLLFIYLLSYSVIRFVDEFFRGDTYRGFVGPFSTSQIISLGLFLFSLAMIIISNKKRVKKHAKN